MKGIYLTEEGKKEIEYRVAELEAKLKIEKKYIYPDTKWVDKADQEIDLLKEILNSSPILPTRISKSKDYPNGVITIPKQ
jgi:hypothetical protein